MRTDALIGIFWLVRDDDGQVAMPMRTCSLDKAEEYGDCLTFGEGHYLTWEAWKENRLRLDPSSPGLRRAVSWSEYGTVARSGVRRRLPLAGSGRFCSICEMQAAFSNNTLNAAFLLRSAAQAIFRSEFRLSADSHINPPTPGTGPFKN